ncbi:hypothetical protein RCC89_14095 [Cytophagaceae bacterium ABcell3]|nr:hypothetical protein RCC89_14095 [Cytophagaceae bacterium ABcell3]
MKNQKKHNEKGKAEKVKKTALSDGGEFISVRPHKDDFSDQDHKENFDFDKAKGYTK